MYFTHTSDQGWPTSTTGGPHNSLKICARAALVYTRTEKRGRMNSVEICYLQTTSYAKRMVKEKVVGLINSTKHKEILVYLVLS
jgi:hypothetical protein